MSIIAASGISKSFVTQLIFRDATFRIEEKDRIGIVGTNGAGKTTLFKILTGAEDVDEGTIYYDVYNNNTDVSDETGYGTLDNLVEFVKPSSKKFVYGVGDSMPTTVKDDYGNSLLYNFTVDAITEDSATITFTKNK